LRIDEWVVCLFRYGISSQLLKEVKNYPMSECRLFHIDGTRNNSNTKSIILSRSCSTLSSDAYSTSSVSS
jgi:hypothetical protein